MTGGTARRFVDRWVLFTWWTRANARVAAWSRLQLWTSFAIVAVVGSVLRLWAATFPNTYDFASYLVVSDEYLAGGNVYATGRHNYGPVWFLIHGNIRRFLADPVQFRVALAITLALVDVAIALLLTKRGYPLAAWLFLLAPVTIAISGQHAQFDNIAVALALCAAFVMTTGGRGSALGWRDAASVAVLGLSLATKHDFLLLPIWFAFMQGTWVRRLFYAITPLLILGVSLLPFWLIDSGPIREFVLGPRYNSVAPAYYAFLPDDLVRGWVDSGVIVFVFLVVLIVLGWLYRRLPSVEATLVYAISLVVFSTAIVDQYLAIPVAGAAVFLNIGFVAWLGYVSIYLLGEPADLNLPVFNTLKLQIASQPEIAYQAQFAVLLAGWLLMNVWLWRTGWLRDRRREANPAPRSGEAPN